MTKPGFYFSPRSNRKYSQATMNKIVQLVANGEYCALLGPRFSGKGDLLRIVEKMIVQDQKWVCVHIDLLEMAVLTQKDFFTDLVNTIISSVLTSTGFQLPMPVEGVAHSSAFREFLAQCPAWLKNELVLIIGHLEAVPKDLIQPLLTSLRAIYMEQQSCEHRLMVIVSGALSLANFAVGKTSPFYNIARRIFMDDFSEEESKELIATQLKLNGISISEKANNLLLAATRDDPNLIEQISQQCIKLVKGRVTTSQKITTPTVKRVVENFICTGAPRHKRLEEALRLIEDDTDLLRCILLIHERGTVPKRELPLPLSFDLDPLFLTGMVRKAGENYQFRNYIYAQFLKRYFDPGRVGQIMTMAGKWDTAIDYLESGIKAKNECYGPDLLAATVNAIYASDDVKQAAAYLIRGLSVVFEIEKIIIWHFWPADKLLRKIGQRGITANVNGEICLDEDHLETRALREGRPLRGQEDNQHIIRAIPLRIPGDEPIGVITFIERTSINQPGIQHSRDPEIMRYLNQAARAIQEITNRENQRHREKERRELAETLQEISTVLNESLELEQVLKRILNQMSRVLQFDTASIQLLNRKKLRIIASKGFECATEVENLEFSIEDKYPNVHVWRQKEPKAYPDVAKEFPHFKDPQYHVTQVRSWLGVPLLVDDACIGVITLDSYKESLYTDEHQQLALTFAGQASVAIKNARLLTEKEQKAKQLSVFHGLDQAIAASLTRVQDVLLAFARYSAQLLPFEYLSIWLLKANDNRHITYSFQENRGIVAQQGIYSEVKNSVFGWVKTKGQILLRNNMITDHHNFVEDDSVIAKGFHSAMFIPLKIKGDVIGTINLYSQKVGAYSLENWDAAQSMADQVAIAIENTRLYEEMEERTHILEKLLEGSRVLTENISEDPKTVLDKFAEIACRSTKAHCAVVYPYQAETRTYDKHNVGTYGLQKPGKFRAEDKPREYGTSLTADIITRGRRIVPNIATDNDKGLRTAKFIQREEICAFIGVPILLGEEPVGVIFVNYREPHQFSRAEEQTIEILANHAAAAILKNRLYQQTSEALKKRIHEMEVLQEIDDQITSTLELPEIVTTQVLTSMV